MCMIADEDYWTYYRDGQRTARKAYRCGECGRTIATGERYAYAEGVHEGAWVLLHTCRHCAIASAWLLWACEGWIYTRRLEDFADHVVGDEREIRSAALVRLYRWMRAGWLNRAGNLRPAEDVQALTDRAIAAYRRRYDRAVAA